MSTFRDWEAYKRLKNRADTNSVVDVLKNKSTGDLIVRKIMESNSLCIKLYSQGKCVLCIN